MWIVQLWILSTDFHTSVHEIFVGQTLTKVFYIYCWRVLNVIGTCYIDEIVLTVASCLLKLLWKWNHIWWQFCYLSWCVNEIVLGKLGFFFRVCRGNSNPFPMLKNRWFSHKIPKDEWKRYKIKSCLYYVMNSSLGILWIFTYCI